MRRPFRLKARVRRFGRRHPRLYFAIRSFVTFSAAFGGAYGFITGSRSNDYDPSTFAMGISALFAAACVALATLSLRMRWLHRKMHRLALHNERLVDRNWELKEAEERARSLFELQGDLVVLRAADGTITFVNDAYCDLAQHARDDLLGSRHALPVIEQGETTIDDHGARSHDQKVATAAGPRWIAWREGLIRSNAGELAELQCVGRDVTERTEAGRLLGEARDHADAASKAKSRFLAMASHEIRTPLNGIIGMNGLLLESALTPEQATYARSIRTSSEALLSLIDGLLDFSKIEAGRIDLEHRPFALAGLVEDITELLAPRAQARQLEIAAYVDERLPARVIGDAARLRQVLLNLAGNAIKFTTAGGVTLIVEPGPAPGDICFLVRDTGIGIAEEAQLRIFREFEQADDRIALNYGGTGLGLSISERIIRRMGGRIGLQSAVGQGSTFEVIVPLATDGSGDDDRKPFETPDLNGRSVMIVSPQGIEASLIARRLARWGAQTCTISDSATARALLPERAWHAILVDAALGRAEVTALGTAAGAHAMHRLILFTPATRHDYPRPSDVGFTGYLVKPLRAASLALRLAGSAIAGAAEPEAGDDEPSGNDAISGDDEVAAPAPHAPRGLSILLAEDNEINALLMRTLLAKLSHQVVLATDGEAALESWIAAEGAGTPYDLVLMDVQMPRLDGIAATRQIRAREAGHRAQRTPILALTANALIEDRYACFEAGMDGFLVKPLDRDRLVDALAGLAPSRHLAA